MAFSYKDYPGDGTTKFFNVPFPFLARDHVSVIDVSDETPVAFSWVTDSQIEINPPVDNSTVIRIRRNTPVDNRVVNFQDATVLDEADLDMSADQNFYVAQEVLDTVDDKMNQIADGTWDAEGKRISNVADPVNDADAVPKAFMESYIQDSVDTSTEAANTAEEARDEAVSARDTTVLTYSEFLKRYLGDFNSDPSTDNEGDPLIVGALYFNTSTGMRVYTGSVWIPVDVVIATKSEAEAGTDNEKYMSPLRTKQAIDKLAVLKDSPTGAAQLPTGTISQRPSSPQEGLIRRNSETAQFEGYTGSGWAGLGGASGGAGNPFVYENDKTVTEDYTITTGKNAISAGPITIADGVTVTVPDGSTWSVV